MTVSFSNMISRLVSGGRSRAKRLLRRLGVSNDPADRGAARFGEIPDTGEKRDLKGRFCEAPFRQIDVYESGRVHLCCASWLPAPIGNLNEDSLDAVWNSKQAQAVRKSIFDGSFKFCSHTLCPRIQGGTLPTMAEAEAAADVGIYVRTRATRLDARPTFVNLCHDLSCNLQCPSCRSERINHTSGPEFERAQRLQNRLTEALFRVPTTRTFAVSVTGSGDPIGSKVFRDFLFGLEGADFPNLQVNLQTNGLLLTPQNWERLGKIHQNLGAVCVSFDAATEKTYRRVRGGNWSTLLSNTAMLAQHRRRETIGLLRLDFVVQKDNFREMVDFVDLGKRLGADQVAFSIVTDWGSWPAEIFREKCIWRNDHPDFAEFLAVLKDASFDDPMVSMGNVTRFRETALNTGTDSDR